MEATEQKVGRLKPGWILIPILSCLILPMVLMVLAEMEALSPRGTGVLNFLMMLALGGCCCIVIPLIFIICGFRLFYKRDRQVSVTSVIWMTSALSIFIGAVAGGSISQHMKMEALPKLAERSNTLIAAIKLYEQKEGAPPDTLAALVPEFIPNIPTTGIGVCPKYDYRSLTNNWAYGNNKWVLQVQGAGDPISFDTFIYLPMQDYSILHETHIRKIGDWAYVHRG